MSDSMDLAIDPDDRLYDPPLVDSIYFDEEKRGFAVTFIPSDDASAATKEFVFISDTAPDFPRVLTFWKRIQELLNSPRRIERIVHGGGGSYAFHFIDGSSQELPAISEEHHHVVEVSDRLKQIADAAQIAFLDRSYSKVVPRIA